MANEPILNDDELSQIRESLNSTLGSDLQAPRLMQLGKLLPDGAIQTKVPQPTYPGELWVRAIGEGAGDAVPAINTVLTADQIVPNTFVEVKPWGGGLRIVSLAPEHAMHAGGVPVPPQRPIDISKLDHGLLRPSKPESMRAILTTATYTLDTDVYLVPTLYTKDFTGDIPGSNAVGVQVTVDPTDATLYYATSSSFAAALTLREAWADLDHTVPSGRFLAGFVRLYAGQDVIRRGDVLSAQEVLAKAGGGGTVFDPDTIVVFEGQVVTHDGAVLIYEEP